MLLLCEDFLASTVLFYIASECYRLVSKCLFSTSIPNVLFCDPAEILHCYAEFDNSLFDKTSFCFL